MTKPAHSLDPKVFIDDTYFIVFSSIKSIRIVDLNELQSKYMAEICEEYQTKNSSFQSAFPWVLLAVSIIVNIN